MGVLDDMTKGITERKAEKAGPKLTPVGTEASPTKPSQAGVPEVPEVFLTNEAIADIARDLRAQAATLTAVADGLDKLTATVTDKAIDEPKKAAVKEKKAKEQAADEKFAAEYAAKQAVAQAAVFVNSDAESEEPAVEAPATGWVCPDHGASNLKQLESRLGRLYMACQVEDCNRFEK